MTVLLILLYVLAANGAAIPVGCFAAAWVIAVIKLMAKTVKFICDLGGEKK